MQINQLPAASSLNNQDKFAVDTTDGITKSITASQLVELTRTNSYGAPLAAGTAAAMTDTSKVYVYTGNETGYTNGDWYYYNGTAWVSGGAYNSVAVNTDKTLRLSGVAADAKAVGDANAALSADILTVSGDLEEATEKIYSDIATDYDNLTWPVSAGQYCIYLGRTYKANQDIPTIESWNASHWTRTNLGEGLSDLGDVQGDIAGLQAAIASEASARQAADTSLNNAISAEASAREATDTALNGSIIAEATAREAADDELKSALAEDDVLFKLHAEEIDGTTQTVVYENGQIKRILHKYSNNDQLVRTDAYTFGDTQIVETRTLATGDTMTITTNLSTLQTTVQTILVPAA